MTSTVWLPRHFLYPCFIFSDSQESLVPTSFSSSISQWVTFADFHCVCVSGPSLDRAPVDHGTWNTSESYDQPLQDFKLCKVYSLGTLCIIWSTTQLTHILRSASLFCPLVTFLSISDYPRSSPGPCWSISSHLISGCQAAEQCLR